MAKLPEFNLSAIKDPVLRQNFEALQDFFRDQSPLLGFKHFEVTFDRAVTNHKFRHGLGFKPSDILLTSSIGAGVVTFNHDKCTAESIDMTVTDACTVRFFAGTYNSKP